MSWYICTKKPIHDWEVPDGEDGAIPSLRDCPEHDGVVNSEDARNEPEED